jgi:peptidoglycan/xylan/chitin deacetylase (PgdA/CDA1 family)
LTTLTNEEIVAEVIHTAKAIYDIIGVMPVYFRPPCTFFCNIVGDIDPRVRAVLKSLGMTIVLWNRETADATSRTVNATFAQWFSQPRVGTISLQHDLFASAAAQIPPVLNMTSRSGYNFKTVANCLGKNDAYTEFPNVPDYVPFVDSPVNLSDKGPVRTGTSDGYVAQFGFLGVLAMLSSWFL